MGGIFTRSVSLNYRQMYRGVVYFSYLLERFTRKWFSWVEKMTQRQRSCGKWSWIVNASHCTTIFTFKDDKKICLLCKFPILISIKTCYDSYRHEKEEYVSKWHGEKAPLDTVLNTRSPSSLHFLASKRLSCCVVDLMGRFFYVCIPSIFCVKT